MCRPAVGRRPERSRSARQPRALGRPRSRVGAGDDELGWLAKSGRLALGYLGDAAKTERTYPVIDGVRYAVPGDRAKLRADGMVELHGRDSVDDQLRRREDLRRGGRGGDQGAPRRVRLRRRRPAERTVGQRGGRRRALRSGRPQPTSRLRLAAAEQTGALQAAEGLRVRRRGRALAVGQGRLPLGQTDRRRFLRGWSASHEIIGTAGRSLTCSAPAGHLLEHVAVGIDQLDPLARCRAGRRSAIRRPAVAEADRATGSCSDLHCDSVPATQWPSGWQ